MSRAVDLIVAVCLALSLAVGPAAWVAAVRLPLATESGAASSDAVQPRPGADRRPDLVSLPAGSPGGVLDPARLDRPRLGDVVSVRAALNDVAATVGLADRLPDLLEIAVREHEGVASADPLGFTQLESALDDVLTADRVRARPDELNDLAVLLIYLSAYHDDGAQGWAPSLAYVLLRTVRDAAPSCLVQRNLAFLLSTELEGLDDVVRAEFRRAAQLCGSDPTSMWYLGQFQVARSFVTRFDHNPGVSLADLQQRPLITFREMQAADPTSPLGWTGEADAWLKLAEERTYDEVEPFLARSQFRRARDLYRHAQTLTSDPAPIIGAARALSGMGQVDDAVAEADRAIAVDPQRAIHRVIKVEILQRGHRLADAAASAVTADATLPDGWGLSVPDPRNVELTRAPTTFGLIDSVPVNLAVHAWDPSGGGGVTDYAFIPRTRPFGSETDVDGWCPIDGRWRDLIAVGRAADVLAEVDNGTSTTAGVGGRDCVGDVWDQSPPDDGEGSPDYYAALAALDLEDEVAFVRWAGPNTGEPPSDEVVSDYFEHLQNLYRFGFNLTSAERVCRQWTTRFPSDPLAWDRLGEVQFLAGDVGAAADSFGRALAAYQRRIDDEGPDEAHGNESHPTGLDRARALLKLGAALDRAGRPGAEEAWLRASSEASLLETKSYEAGFYADRVVSHAHNQLADRALRAGEFTTAVAGYQQAQAALVEHVSRFRRSDGVWERYPAPEFNGVIENNLALAYTRLGEFDQAEHAAEEARQLTRPIRSSPRRLPSPSNDPAIPSGPSLPIPTRWRWIRRCSPRTTTSVCCCIAVGGTRKRWRPSGALSAPGRSTRRAGPISGPPCSTPVRSDTFSRRKGRWAALRCWTAATAARRRPWSSTRRSTTPASTCPSRYRRTGPSPARRRVRCHR